MDPSSLFATAIEKALAITIDHLAKASAVRKTNVTSCLHYLRAAQAAVVGLEEEVDEILIQAKTVARFRWEERALVVERIDRYLNRDRLRPLLDQSLHGLQACRTKLEQDPGFFGRKQKLELVASLAGLMDELIGYLRSLSGAMQYSPENYIGPSGVNFPELLVLQKLLADSGTSPPVLEAVEQLQAGRRRQGLVLVADASTLLQEISVVFQIAAASDA